MINGKECKLKEAGSNNLAWCTSGKMSNLLQHPNQLATTQLCNLQLDTKGESPFAPKLRCAESHTTLAQVISDYADVFGIPTLLSPAQDCDHQVILKEGAMPTNLKPYRYPSAQKMLLRI